MPEQTINYLFDGHVALNDEGKELLLDQLIDLAVLFFEPNGGRGEGLLMLKSGWQHEEKELKLQVEALEL